MFRIAGGMYPVRVLMVCSWYQPYTPPGAEPVNIYGRIYIYMHAQNMIDIVGPKSRPISAFSADLPRRHEGLRVAVPLQQLGHRGTVEAFRAAPGGSVEGGHVSVDLGQLGGPEVF